MLIAVAESKSFSATARLHNISPATLSKQIARIEKELDVQLFKRHTRFLEITDEGKLFVESVRNALDILNEAETQIKHCDKLSGSINITAPLLLGHHYIAPIIASFHTMYPLLRVNLRLTDHIIDLYSQGIDVAIRVGKLVDSNLIAKHLSTNRRILVASPQYLAKNQALTHPKQLSTHQCLLFSYPGYRQDKWVLHHKQADHKPEKISVNGHLSSDSGEVLKQWCLFGKGIALRETWEVTKEIQEKRLIHLLPDWQEPGAAISILYQQRQYIPQRVSVFIQYLTEHWSQRI